MPPPPPLSSLAHRAPHLQTLIQGLLAAVEKQQTPWCTLGKTEGRDLDMHVHDCICDWV